ncbi:MAG: PAS domain S-box protein, partial [Gemmatimonadetes bacterium]|nr:PAS domain S-box protein [Gemmatimonadota bacterium]
MTESAHANNRERLSLLAHMTSLFASGVDLEATLRGVVNLFVPHFADGASLDLLQGDTLQRVAAATTLDDPAATGAVADVRPQGLSLEHAESRRLLESGETRIYNFESSADDVWSPESTADGAIRRDQFPLSLIVAPLRARGQTLGVMQLVAVRGTRRFADEDADLVATVAQRAAFAIHNAQLVTSLQHELAMRAESVTRLEASELRYRRLFEDSPIPLAVIDDETRRFLAVNSATIASYGYSREEFLAMTIFDVRPESEFSSVYEAISVDSRRAAHRHVHPTDARTAHIARSRSTRTISSSTGGARRMVQALDVTERARAFEALRISAERHRLLSRVTKEAIWEWNPATGELQWNAAIYDLFRYAPGEVEPSMAWFESRMHPEDRDGAAGLLAEAIRSQHEHCTRRYRFQRGDGTFAMVEGRAVIAWVNGIAERVIGSIADITVEQQVGEQLAIAQRMEAVGAARRRRGARLQQPAHGDSWL